MTNALFNRNSLYLIYGIPAIVVLTCVAIGLSPLMTQHPEFAIAITLDLTISAPLFYFLLIRKTDIPKITVIPVFTGGMFIASWLVPTHQQGYLDVIMYWLFPVGELVFLVYAGYTARKIIKSLISSKNESPDVYTVIRSICSEIVDKLFSSQLLVDRVLVQSGRKPLSLNWYTEALAGEMAMIYYGIISWKRFRLKVNHFTYHKKSGTVGLFGVFIFLIIAETIVFHVLIEQWSWIAAWILSFSSLYAAMLIFAHIKAVYQRPIEIADDKLFVRNGLFGDTEIDIDNIEKIELSFTVPQDETGLKRVSLLGELEQFNTIIRLRNEDTFRGFYGIKSKYKTLLLFVDENAKLKEQLETYESR